MNTHELKCWPQYYEPVESGMKPFEIRQNDRGFQVGDKLVLREWVLEDYCPDTGYYTGRECTLTITYMTDFYQATGYVVLGVR